MEGSASAFPDWAHLPPLVLNLISEKVKSIVDFVRFRAVCAPWRSASLVKPGHLPLQLPWLMIPHPMDQGFIDPTEEDGIRLFYDLWQDKMHKIHLPETIGKMCCASCHGWLLLAASDRTELFLLNPLTQSRVELPMFTNIFQFIGVVDDFGITKMIFSTDLTDPNCLIIVVRHEEIYLCKVGDHCWTNAVSHPVRREAIPLPMGRLFLKDRLLLKDVTYNNGSLYLLYEEVMFIYDLNQRRQGAYFFEPELERISKFFLEGKSGLYVVTVHNIEGAGQKVELYEVQEHPMELKRIVDTSDIAIFHGDNNHYLAVCTDDWDSLDRDCMYILCVDHITSLVASWMLASLSQWCLVFARGC